MIRKIPASAYTRGAVALRVILSAAIAVPITSFGSFAVMELSRIGSTAGPGSWWELPDMLVRTLANALGASYIGMIIASPLIALSVGLGIALHKNIARNLAAWCIASPFILSTAACAIIALLSGEGGGHVKPYLARLVEILFSSEGLFLVLAPIPAAVMFYALSRRAEKETIRSTA